MSVRRLPKLGSNPMVGFEELKARPEGAVFVVTPGSYDAAKKLFSKWVVVTWAGTIPRWKGTDWSPLAVPGKSVTLIPEYLPQSIDAYIGGEAGANRRFDGLADVLRAGDATVRIMQIPRNVRHGWSLANSGWSADDALEYCKNNRESSHPPYVPPAEIENPLEGNEHFACLGYDHEKYYFFSRAKRQIVSFSSPTSNHLMQIAPLDFWRHHFGTTRGEFQLIKATDHLFNLSHKSHIYSRDCTRGLGAWWDAGRPVVHLGDALIVNGQHAELHEIESDYLYERAQSISPPLNDPLPDELSAKFITLCEMLPWEHSIDGRLLAGWCALAPIGGALQWRPHIWLTGKAGSGKTWVYDKIVIRVVGGFALPVSSTTTEAGLRGHLQSDALPVIFDEIKPKSENASARIRNVMGLMRQAASDSSAKIFKGTAEGGAKSYVIRSMFAIASVTTEIEDEQDSSRITVMSLNNPKNRGDQQFIDLQAFRAETLTDLYIQRLHARTIQLIPVIRKNAETFAIATAKVLGTRRAGDQIGTLLAGAYSLQSREEISVADAEEWLAGKKEKIIVSHEEGTELADDAEQCMHWLLGRRITVQTGEDTRLVRREMLVAEALTVALGTRNIDGMTPGEAHRELKRHGIGVAADLRYFIVSNSLESTKELMRGSPWDRGWGSLLKNLPGARSTKSPFGFAPGINRRGTWIPKGLIHSKPDAPDQGELAIGVTPEGEPDPGDDYERGE